MSSYETPRLKYLGNLRTPGPALPPALISFSVTLERLTCSSVLRLCLHETRNSWMQAALLAAFARSFKPVPTRRALGLFDAINRRGRVLVVDRHLLGRLLPTRATS